MSAEQNKDVVRRLHDLWNTGDLSQIQNVFSADFVGHWPRSSRLPERRGLGAVRAGIVNTRTAFPDWYEHVEEMIAEGDRVVTRYTSTGTHQGDFWGIAATGKRITVHEVSIYRVARGKVVEQWCWIDELDRLQQLGALPSRPQQRAQLAQCLLGIVDLDRHHPECSRGFEIAPDVVEERGAVDGGAELAARELVDSGIGLAQPDHARFDERVEMRTQRVRRGPVFLHPVVRQCADAQPASPQTADRFEHARPRPAGLGNVRHERRRFDLDAARAAVRLERRAECLDRQLPTLETRPCAGLTRRDHDAVDRPRGDPVIALVACDGAQWRIADHAAEVEEHPLDHA